VQAVERWNSHARVRQDLYGCLDVLAVGPDIVGVQATSGSNVAARIRKLEASSANPVLKAAGIRVPVHGRRKIRGRWQLREAAL
jgi:hypothetical protein